MTTTFTTKKTDFFDIYRIEKEANRETYESIPRGVYNSKLDEFYPIKKGKNSELRGLMLFYAIVKFRNLSRIEFPKKDLSEDLRNYLDTYVYLYGDEYGEFVAGLILNNVYSSKVFYTDQSNISYLRFDVDDKTSVIKGYYEKLEEDPSSIPFFSISEHTFVPIQGFINRSMDQLKSFLGEFSSDYDLLFGRSVPNLEKELLNHGVSLSTEEVEIDLEKYPKFNKTMFETSLRTYRDKDGDIACRILLHPDQISTIIFPENGLIQKIIDNKSMESESSK